MYWHLHIWRDLRWFKMICVKLTCSCSIALTNSEILWKCGCCFLAIFPNLAQHKMQHHPPATMTAAQHISGASLNFPKRSSTDAKLFTVVSVSRCSGPSWRSVASRSRRRSGSASAKAPRASSTWASLSRGSPREPKSSQSFRGERVFDFVVSWIQISGSNIFWAVAVDPSPSWENKILGFELFWFHLSSCYRLYLLMLFDACCKYCCLLQSTAFTLRLYGISGCKSVVTGQYSSWLNNTCLLMCWSLWRDWGPHRLSARSAKRCSGPNLSAIASARHRSLGPWWCLSHGCAYHMAVRWPTMSPTAVDQHGRQGISREWPTVRKMAKVWDSFRLQSEAPWLLGCNPWPLLPTRDLQPNAFTHEGGGAGFLKFADVCSTWSG